MTLHDVIMYETANSSLFMTFWNRWFTASFVKRCVRKFERLKLFNEEYEKRGNLELDWSDDNKTNNSNV